MSATLEPTGEFVATDPEYGWQWRTVEAIGSHRRELAEEVGCEPSELGAEVAPDGSVWVTLGSRRLWSARMSDHHADARLCLAD